MINIRVLILDVEMPLLKAVKNLNTVVSRSAGGMKNANEDADIWPIGA